MAISVIDMPVTINGQKRAELFLETVVVNLDTYLVTPDLEIIKQGSSVSEDKVSMYWVGHGKVKVRVHDHNGREITIGNLTNGQHFGEISLLYLCNRSADVISL